ncbi:hypothetical protein CRG98_046608 [Punica granatum]|uniref:Uncharacterized protein n=1 Tax=Punica granatum TaxID=22663 RepID=A0A2I0HN38_PUNGR|nr:hypothetical protein CRG98_046608 [Punica granatum]
MKNNKKGTGSSAGGGSPRQPPSPLARRTERDLYRQDSPLPLLYDWRNHKEGGWEIPPASCPLSDIAGGVANLRRPRQGGRRLVGEPSPALPLTTKSPMPLATSPQRGEDFHRKFSLLITTVEAHALLQGNDGLRRKK